MNLKPEEISAVIRSQIRNYRSRFEISDYGTVLQVGDGIARVYGLSQCMEGELLQFESGVYGMALNLEEDNVGVVILGSDREIKEGDIVVVRFRARIDPATLTVSDALGISVGYLMDGYVAVPE